MGDGLCKKCKGLPHPSAQFSLILVWPYHIDARYRLVLNDTEISSFRTKSRYQYRYQYLRFSISIPIQIPVFLKKIPIPIPIPEIFKKDPNPNTNTWDFQTKYQYQYQYQSIAIICNLESSCGPRLTILSLLSQLPIPAPYNARYWSLFSLIWWEILGLLELKKRRVLWKWPCLGSAFSVVMLRNIADKKTWAERHCQSSYVQNPELSRQYWPLATYSSESKRKRTSLLASF